MIIGWVYAFGTLMAVVVLLSLLVADIRRFFARQRPGWFGRWAKEVGDVCRSFVRAGDARG